jgi:CRISPR-associated protein Cas2
LKSLAVATQRGSMKKFVLCYDIQEDKARVRLANLCEQFGIRVQFSVFEFRLNESDYVEFRGRLERAGFESGNYALILYPLHDDDLAKIERFGSSRPWQKTFEFV